MSSKTCKPQVGEESVPTQLIHPKPRMFLTDSVNQPQNPAHELGAPKRPKYNRNINIGKTTRSKPGDSIATQKLKEPSKLRYLPRAVSNEAINVRNFQLPKTVLNVETIQNTFSLKTPSVPASGELITSATGKATESIKYIDSNQKVLTPNTGQANKPKFGFRPLKLTKTLKALPTSDVQEVCRKRIHPETYASKTDELINGVQKETEHEEIAPPTRTHYSKRIDPRIFKNLRSTKVGKEHDLCHPLENNVFIENQLNSTFVLPDKDEESNNWSDTSPTHSANKYSVDPCNTAYDTASQHTITDETVSEAPSRKQRPNVLRISHKRVPAVNGESLTVAAKKPGSPVKVLWACKRERYLRREDPIAALDIGRRVLVGNQKTGILKFCGTVEFEAGIWCGIALDEPEGKNDGTVQGKRYFQCAPNHGLLAPVHKVQIIYETSIYGLDSTPTVGLSRPTASDQIQCVSTSTPTPNSTANSQPCWETAPGHSKPTAQLNSTISKQNSFECDESLGILTPDQMLADLPFATPSDQHLDYMQNCENTMRFLSVDVDNSQSCIQNEELNYDSMCTSSSLRNEESCDAANPNRGGLVDPAFESDASEDFVSRALNLSRSDPKVQDASDRTLSPEDLPMDPPSPQQPLQVKDSGLSTSEEPKLDVIVSGSPGPSSRSLPPPTSIITSVTSIGSLDTDGYQGDGELSRPASRNTCTSPTSALLQRSCPQKMKTSAHDPMTDSDFFTESDADMHEDAGGATRGGDRRAQVIDGTLYNNATGNGGGANPQHQRCPSFTASINEEMESSGVYSDLERKPDEFENTLMETERKMDADCSPDGSTKTVSSKSEASQVKDVTGLTSLPEPAEETRDSILLENNARNLLTKEVPQTHEAMDVVADADCPADTIITIMAPKSPASVRRPIIQHYPMPKRNVVSKVKAMLTASPTSASRSGNVSTEDVHQESVRRPPTRKPGRWDAVLNKIAQGRVDEQKKATDRLKDVKSKVFAGIADGQSPLGGGTPRRKLPAQSNNATKENHTPLKAKSRRARSNRASSSSSVHQSTPGGAGSKTPGRSVCSSQRSSLSDLSLNTTPQPAQQQQQANSTAKQASAYRSSKKQRDITRDVVRSTSPNSDASTASANSHNVTPTRAAPLSQGANNAHKRTTQKNGAGVASDMKTPLVRKPTTSRRNEKHKLQRDHNRLAGVNKPPATAESPVRGFTPSNDATSTPLVVREPPLPPSPQVDLRQFEAVQQALDAAQVALEAARLANRELEQRNVHYVKGFDALTILSNHLINDYDALSMPKVKQQLEETKAAKNEATLALDEMSAKLRRLEDDSATAEREHRAALEAAKENYQSETKKLGEALQAEIEALREAGRAEMEALKDKHEAELNDVMHQQQQAIQLADLAELQKKNKEATLLHEAEMRQRQAETCKILETSLHEKDFIRVSPRHWREQKDEVSSLRSVLELRHGELQELRLKNSMLERDKDELEASQKKASTYKARVEDLELQLKLKKDEEHRFSLQNQSLSESLHNESLSNKRLVQEKEELEWKLNNALHLSAHNSTLVSVCDNSLASPSVDVMSTKSVPDAASNDSSDIFLSACSLASELDINPNITLTTSYLERSDSVSWIYEMDTPEDAVQKILQRRSASMKKINTSRSNSNNSPSSSQLSPRIRSKANNYVSSPEHEYSNASWGLPCSSTPINSTDSQGSFTDSFPLVGSSVGSVLSFPLLSSSGNGDEHSTDSTELAISSEEEAGLPLLPLSGSKSADLAFMGVQLPPVPKDAGGEAMISEETSEEDNSVDPQSSDDESSSEIQ